MTKKKSRRARKSTSQSAPRPKQTPSATPEAEADAPPDESPSLPLAVLDEEDAEHFDYPVQDDAEALERATAAVSGKRKRQRRKAQQEATQMSAEEIAYLLAHPTKHVSEAELRQQYDFVIKDIRNMFALTAVLILALIGLAQFI